MEVKLYNSSMERRKLDELAELYALIKTVEHLEIAYTRDAIGQEEYSRACTKLISQYKSMQIAVRDQVEDVEGFMGLYRLECPRAVERLMKVGVPATVLHNTNNGKADAVNVAQTVQYFITVLDSLKLNVRAVDEIQPLLTELMTSMTQVSGLPNEFQGRIKMEFWLVKLNKMRAFDELDDDMVRQLSYELEQSYTNFMAFLNT